MSYYEGTPYGIIAAKKKLKQTEDLFKDWRTVLVQVGERLLLEIEKGNVSEEIKKEFREFIEKTKAASINRE